jgi:hypothetical protein
MRRLIAVLSVAGCIVGVADTARAQTCIQDEYGRVTCGQRIRPQRAPPGYYQDGPDYERGYRYSPRVNRYGEDGSKDCYTYRGRRICCPHQWTVQDGVCKPYSGR